MKIIDPPIVVAEMFTISKEKLWNSITSIKEMKQWYFEMLPDFKPEVGFKTAFDVQSEDRNFHHIWTITEVIPYKKISYLWQFEEYQGKSISHFEIEELGKQTKLSVTVDVLADFTENIPEFKPESCRAGWEYFIKLRLKNYIEKTTK